MAQGSIRVEGRGNAIIHDVVIKNVSRLPTEADPPKVGKIIKIRKYILFFKITNLKAAILEEKNRLQKITDRGTVVQKCVDNLDKVFEQVGGGLVNPPKDGVASLNEGTLESLTNFFQFYGSNSELYRESEFKR